MTGSETPGEESKNQPRCLLPAEVTTYLAPARPEALTVRVDQHIARCRPCRDRIQHVDDDVLEYVEGRCSPIQLERIDAHLDDCDACRELVHQIIRSVEPTSESGVASGSDWITTFTPRSVVNSRYEIRRFVGRGGMGEVYEAFDRLMGTRIALKTVLCTSADRVRAARKLKEEVLHAQRVGHPHVCRINELQEHHDGASGHPLPFFTMEFVDGERLGDRIRKGSLSLEQIQIIAVQLLEGLNAAHSRGVLHLDFKSDNVMLRSKSGDPDAVIMDFGLSRALGNEVHLHTSERHQLAGTLPYMALEQLECRDDLGPPADVYAFGVLLYEMLTRVYPFEPSSLATLLLKQLKERPRPPSHYASQLSPALDQFVLKCLNTDARSRYPDAGRALAALTAIGPWQSTPRRRTRRRRLLAAAVIFLGLGAAGAVASQREPTLVVAPSLPSPPAARLAPEPLGDEQAVDSADRVPASGPSREPPAREPPAREPPAREPQPRGVTAAPRANPAAPPGPPERAMSHPRRGRVSAGKAVPADVSVSTPPPPTVRSTAASAVAMPSPDPPKHAAAERTPTDVAPRVDDWRPARVPRQLAPPARSASP